MNKYFNWVTFLLATTCRIDLGFFINGYLVTPQIAFGIAIVAIYPFLNPTKWIKLALYTLLAISPLLVAYHFSPIQADLKATLILRAYLNLLTVLVVSVHCIRVDAKNFYYLCYGMLCQPFLTIFIYQLANPIFIDDSYRLGGANVFAASIICAIPYLFLLNVNKFNIIYHYLIFPLSILTFSRMLFLCYGINLVIKILFLRKNSFKSLVNILLILIIALFIFNIGNERLSSNDERWLALQSSYTTFMRYPYFGVGFGGWENINNLSPSIDNLVIVTGEDGKISTLNPHNSFARILIDLGMVGISIFLFILTYFLINYKNLKIIIKYKTYFYLTCSSLFTQFILSDVLEQLSVYILIGSIFILSKITNLGRRI